MSLYGANGQINTTSVAGSSYTGLHAADGSYNIVVNTSSTYVGLHHACGAYNAFVVTDASAGYYAPNGSMNVIANGSSPSGYSPVQPRGSSSAVVQAVATGGLPIVQRSGGFTGGIMHQSLSTHVLCGSDVQWMQIGDTDITGLSWLVSGFDATIEKWVQIVGAPTPFVKLSYGGLGVGSLTSGTILQFSDKLFPSQFGLTKFTADTVFLVYDQKTWSATNASFPFNSIGNTGGANFSGMQYNPSGSYVPITAPGALGFHFLQAPLVIIGQPTTPTVAVFSLGDSLIQSYNPDNGDSILDNGPGGWFMRGLASVNGHALPWTNLGIDANAASNMVGSAAALQLTAALAPYFTHFVCNFGHNSDFSAANEFARMQTIWNTLKTAPNTRIRHINHVLVIPQTTSTDNFATYVNQTPVTQFDLNNPASYASQYNTLILGAVGSQINSTLKHSSIINGPNNNLWLVNGTNNFYVGTDGTHPTTNAHQLMGPEFNTLAATWT